MENWVQTINANRLGPAFHGQVHAHMTGNSP